MLFACFRSQIVTESERCLFGSRFSVALLSSLADFATEIHLGHEKPEHANAAIISLQEWWETVTGGDQCVFLGLHIVN